MSARNYLELVQAIVAELGVRGGTGPTTVVGQTGEYGNLCTWIADADLYIQNLWLNWNFLWTQQTGQDIANGTDYLPVPSDADTRVRSVDMRDRGGLILYPGTSSAYQPTPVFDWRTFRDSWNLRAKTSLARPSQWAIAPDGTIYLSHKVNDDVDFTLDFWQWPNRLIANDDESLIPETFDRIIIVKAKITYAEREDAPEIMAGAAAEYGDLLEKIEAACLPKMENSRMSEQNTPRGASFE